MTLNDKDRDVDLELAEELLSRPWEHSHKKCPSLELPPKAGGPQEFEKPYKRYTPPLGLWYLAIPVLNLWIFRDEVSWVAVDALSALRVQVLTWLGFPGVI